MTFQKKYGIIYIESKKENNIVFHSGAYTFSPHLLSLYMVEIKEISQFFWTKKVNDICLKRTYIWKGKTQKIIYGLRPTAKGDKQMAIQHFTEEQVRKFVIGIDIQLTRFIPQSFVREVRKSELYFWSVREIVRDSCLYLTDEQFFPINDYDDIIKEELDRIAR